MSQKFYNHDVKGCLSALQSILENLNVLNVEHWILEFVWDLSFGIWASKPCLVPATPG